MRLPTISERIDIGKYAVNHAGRSLRMVIPSDIVETWNLKDKEEVFLYFQKGNLIVSRKKLPEMEDT